MFLKNKNVIEFIRENKSNDIAINKILKGNEDLKNPLRNIPVITKYWYSNKILYFMLNSNDKFKVFMGGCHIKFNVSSIFVKDLPIDNAKLDILYKLIMLYQIKDMLCRIKNGQKIYKQKVCLHKNVNKNCIQILRLLEKEGFVNEKSPFNVYVVVTLFNNKIKAVKSLTRIYIRNILLKKIENISQMLDVVLWQNYLKKKEKEIKNKFNISVVETFWKESISYLNLNKKKEDQFYLYKKNFSSKSYVINNINLNFFNKSIKKAILNKRKKMTFFDYLAKGKNNRSSSSDLLFINNLEEFSEDLLLLKVENSFIRFYFRDFIKYLFLKIILKQYLVKKYKKNKKYYNKKNKKK